MSDQPLTDAEIEEGLALCEAATDGPWGDNMGDVDQMTDAGKAYPLDFYHPYGDCVINESDRDEPVFSNDADRAFVILARTLLPRVLAEVRRLEDEVRFWIEAQRHFHSAGCGLNAGCECDCEPATHETQRAAVAAEREACALLMEHSCTWEDAAAAIRARGEGG